LSPEISFHHSATKRPATLQSNSSFACGSVQQQSLLFRLILSYGWRFPYHRGKGWLVERLLRLFRIQVNDEFDVERAGLRWRLNPADFVQADVFWLGRKDYYDIYNLQKLFHPDNVFLDVGANFGYYSLVMASRFDRQCVVHAFEPNPPTLARLRHHVAINSLGGVVQVHDVALSDQAGTACLATKEGNSGGAHIVDCDRRTIEVKLTTLDDFCDQQHLTRLDAIKIDVEGFEERVLRGAERSLRRWRPVLLMELEPARLRDKQTSVTRVIHFLQKVGYELFVSRRQTLVSLHYWPEGDDAQMNVFCLPREEAVSIGAADQKEPTDLSMGSARVAN
jgi:FkbM family methyltransferase